jgi:hypothetical protein
MTEKDPWLVRPTSIRLMWRLGLALLAAIAALDLIVHPHGYFGIDGTVGFYSWFGFLACLAMVVVAKILGVLVKRSDDHYDR